MPVVFIFIGLNDGKTDKSDFPFLSLDSLFPVVSKQTLKTSPYWRLKPNLREAWKKKSAIRYSDILKIKKNKKW